MKKINTARFVFLLVIFFLSVRVVTAQNTYGSSYLNGIAIMGDSTSDEYQANDNRGGAYHSVSFSWDEVLVRSRNLNFGVWGIRSEPRRTGYEYNWARSGLEAKNLISSGQAAGIAQQIRDGKVGYVIVFIGGNDFGWWNTTDGFIPIYNGTLSGTALNQKVQTMVTNVTQSMQTILQAGNVKMMFVTLGDLTKSPTTVSQYPDATKQLRVRNAVASYNNQVITFAQANGIAVFDTDVFYQTAILSKLNMTTGKLTVGGEEMIFSSGNEPHYMLLGDGIHAGTVLNGLLSNGFIERINTQLGSTIPTLTEVEIVTIAGIGDVTPTPQGKQGDANKDGVVNGQDYVIWLQNYQTTTTQGSAKGDFNGDSTVNGQDFGVWFGLYER